METYQYYELAREADALHGPASRVEARNLSDAAEVVASIERLGRPAWVWRSGGWECVARRGREQRRLRVEALR